MTSEKELAEQHMEKDIDETASNHYTSHAEISLGETEGAMYGDRGITKSRGSHAQHWEFDDEEDEQVDLRPEKFTEYYDQMLIEARRRSFVDQQMIAGQQEQTLRLQTEGLTTKKALRKIEVLIQEHYQGEVRLTEKQIDELKEEQYNLEAKLEKIQDQLARTKSRNEIDDEVMYGTPTSAQRRLWKDIEELSLRKTDLEEEEHHQEQSHQRQERMADLLYRQMKEEEEDQEREEELLKQQEQLKLSQMRLDQKVQQFKQEQEDYMTSLEKETFVKKKRVNKEDQVPSRSRPKESTPIQTANTERPRPPPLTEDRIEAHPRRTTSGYRRDTTEGQSPLPTRLSVDELRAQIDQTLIDEEEQNLLQLLAGVMQASQGTAPSREQAQLLARLAQQQTQQNHGRQPRRRTTSGIDHDTAGYQLPNRVSNSLPQRGRSDSVGTAYPRRTGVTTAPATTSAYPNTTTVGSNYAGIPAYTLGNTTMPAPPPYVSVAGGNPTAAGQMGMNTNMMTQHPVMGMPVPVMPGPMYMNVNPGYPMFPNKPMIQLDYFDGKANFQNWRSWFEDQCHINNWDLQQRLNYLKISLKGAARGVFRTLTPAQAQDYNQIMRALKERFGSLETKESLKTELKTLRKRPKETMKEFAFRIQDLVWKAHPEHPRECQDEIARDHFLDALPYDIQKDIRKQAEPIHSLTDVVQRAVKVEHANLLGPAPRMKTIEVQEEDDSSFQVNEVTQSRSTTLNNHQPRSKQRAVTFSTPPPSPSRNRTTSQSTEVPWEQQVEKMVNQLWNKLEQKIQQHPNNQMRSPGRGERNRFLDRERATNGMVTPAQQMGLTQDQCALAGLCFNCAQPGHYAAQCPLRNHDGYHRTVPYAGQQMGHQKTYQYQPMRQGGPCSPQSGAVAFNRSPQPPLDVNYQKIPARAAPIYVCQGGFDSLAPSGSYITIEEHTNSQARPVMIQTEDSRTTGTRPEMLDIGTNTQSN